MAKAEKEANVENVVTDITVPQETVVDSVITDNVIVDDTFPQEPLAPPVYVEESVSPEQAIALLEQGAFDYYIQGVDAVLSVPYTEGSAEHFYYTQGWNKAFDEANKA